MAILVRSWNVFHGRTHPPARRAYMEQCVRLVVEDGPDVACLQEVPLWALSHLEQWSGMAAYVERTRRGLGRPGRRLTDSHHAFFRSALTGQANALLVGTRLTAMDHRRLVLNDRPSDWARERRICQLVRVRDGTQTMVVANLHLSHMGDGGPAEAELRRTVVFADEMAAPREPVVLAGDFNLTAASPAVRELAADQGFSAPGPGIDHVLVRGAPSTPLAVWPVERRTLDGRILSDHPPVELEVG